MVSHYPKVIGKLVTPQVVRVPQKWLDTRRTEEGLVRVTQQCNDIFHVYGNVKVKVGTDAADTITEVLVPKVVLENLENEEKRLNKDSQVKTSNLEYTGSKWRVDLDSIPVDKMQTMHFRDRIYTRVRLISVSIYGTRTVDNSWYVDVDYKNGKAELCQRSCSHLGGPYEYVDGDSIEVDGEIRCTNEYTIERSFMGWDRDGDAIYSDPAHKKCFTFFWEGGQVDIN